MPVRYIQLFYQAAKLIDKIQRVLQTYQMYKRGGRKTVHYVFEDMFVLMVPLNQTFRLAYRYILFRTDYFRYREIRNIEYKRSSLKSFKVNSHR